MQIGIPSLLRRYGAVTLRGPRSYEVPLWRGLTAFRVAAVIFAALLAASRSAHYTHPEGAFATIVVMALWTLFSAYQYAQGERRRWPLLCTDLVITAGCLLATRWVLPPHDIVVTLPMVWIAGPVIAWGISAGRVAGAFAALVIGGCTAYVRGGFDLTAVNESVMLLLAGVAIGIMARLTGEAEARLQQAAEAQAAARERDRLARGIHDSVLQVLALVQRRGAQLGGEAAELGRLAGEQEAALRRLVAAEVDAEPQRNGSADLRAMLGRVASARVSFAAPADAVELAHPVADEVVAAVSAALANVHQHVGADARAWLLLEDERERVVVTVRDEGPGIAPGRLAEAAAAGRLGIAKSIRGRVEELGGTVEITSIPNQGTEIEMRIPRR